MHVEYHAFLKIFPVQSSKRYKVSLVICQLQDFEPILNRMHVSEHLFKARFISIKLSRKLFNYE